MIDYDDWGEKPVPRIDPDSEPYWSAALDGDLALQRCGDCGNYQFYPRAVCRHCWSDDLSFRTAPGKGTVYARTVCHIPGKPGYGDDTPYNVVLVDVDLPEDHENDFPVRLMSHVVDASIDDVPIGTPVEVEFVRIGDDRSVALPVFSPIE